jgi:alcohol dehydrogenase
MCRAPRCNDKVRPPETGRALLLHAPRELRWVDEALPPLALGAVAVQTIAGAISIGTELPLYQGIHRGSLPVIYPRMTGYESLGIIMAVGEAVRELAVGQRVIAFYGHRTHAVVPAARVVPVPQDIGDEQALLLILACDTAKGVAKVNPQPDEPVVITGAGAIGLLTLFNLRAHGMTTVDMVEPSVRRRELAAAFGARHVIAPEQASVLVDRAAVGFECSSTNAGFALLQSALASGGRLCVLADGNLEPLVLTPLFHEKELLIVGSSDGLPYHTYAIWYWEQVRAGNVLLDRLFEHTTTAAELGATFAELAEGRERPVKVLVRYF